MCQFAFYILVHLTNRKIFILTLNGKQKINDKQKPETQKY